MGFIWPMNDWNAKYWTSLFCIAVDTRASASSKPTTSKGEAP